MYIHKYFKRKHTEWSVTGFLNECNEEPFRFKVDIYLKSLVNIINSDQGKKREKAQALFDKRGVVGILLASLPFRSFSRATKPVLGHRQPFSLADEPKPDNELARWENERSHKQVHLHQPTINGTISGPINGAYVTGGTVGTVNGTGTISGGTFDVESFASKKRDQENLQPIYNVQIPPPRVVTPPHPPQTPEHQIFSSSSIVSPTTRSESDEDDFDADDRVLTEIPQ
ncbi:2575_t:CDS:2 [Funneliformis geosporum]|nr:2575_t:CDS:2 [Funneliformis geosporum]